MITKTEFDNMNTNMSGDAQKFEARLDEAMMMHLGTDLEDRPLRVHTSGFSRAIVQRVLNKYIAKGWKAYYVDDSRDGDYVELA